MMKRRTFIKNSSLGSTGLLMAGLAVRGWVNPTYYSLGSDDSESGGLSYMARMGGWSVLDYGLQFVDTPYD